MSGKQVRKVSSGDSKDGANSVAKASILNNVVDHGTVLAEESIRCSMTGNGGNEEGHKLWHPSGATKGVL